jgi:hypothetical protein
VIIPAWYRLDANASYFPVTEIGGSSDTSANGAFSNTSITAISIPASVTFISGVAFHNSARLAGITVDVDNSNYTDEDGILKKKKKTQALIIPDSFATPGLAYELIDNGTSYSVRNGEVYEGAAHIPAYYRLTGN